MRAWQIAKILIITQACIGLVDSMMLMYDEDMGDGSPILYYGAVNDTDTQFVVGDIEDLGPTTDEGFTGMNTFDLGVSLVISGFWLVWSVLSSIICIFPVLVNTFHCPVLIASALQIGIYLEVLYGVAQWKSGRSGIAIES